MRTISPDELKDILAKHLAWCRGEVGGINANLSNANLGGANLGSAYLGNADLRGSNLDLDKVDEATAAQWRILPDDGAVVGWKKCRNGMLVCLEIPHGARRSNAPGWRKCRAETATVIGVYAPDGSPALAGISLHDGVTTYVAGQTLTITDFDDNAVNECAPGIHFYITRTEAEAHQ